MLACCALYKGAWLRQRGAQGSCLMSGNILLSMDQRKVICGDRRVCWSLVWRLAALPPCCITQSSMVGSTHQGSAAAAAAAAAAALAAVAAAVGLPAPALVNIQPSVATLGAPALHQAPGGKPSELRSTVQAVVQAVQAGEGSMAATHAQQGFSSHDSGHNFHLAQVTPSDMQPASEQNPGGLFLRSGPLVDSVPAWDATHGTSTWHEAHSHMSLGSSAAALDSARDSLLKQQEKSDVPALEAALAFMHAHNPSHTDSSRVEDAVNQSQQGGDGAVAYGGHVNTAGPGCRMGQSQAAQPPAMATSVPYTSQDVLDAFRNVPELLAWVSGTSCSAARSCKWHSCWDSAILLFNVSV